MRGESRLEDKYFDDLTGEINLRIQDTRENMREFMPKTLHIIDDITTSNTKKGKKGSISEYIYELVIKFM